MSLKHLHSLKVKTIGLEMLGICINIFTTLCVLHTYMLLVLLNLGIDCWSWPVRVSSDSEVRLHVYDVKKKTNLHLHQSSLYNRQCLSVRKCINIKVPGSFHLAVESWCMDREILQNLCSQQGEEWFQLCLLNDQGLIHSSPIGEIVNIIYEWEYTYTN